MAVSLDLLLGAVVAGILLGGFYAAVTVGVSISFGMLDIVNIAHPAFIILGSYIAYIVNKRLGDESLRGLAFFFGLLFITEVALILVFGVDYRFVDAAYIGYTLHYGPIDLPLRMLVPFVCSLALLAGLQLFLSRSFIGRAITICVMGGLGSFPGMLMAALLLGVVESITATFYGPSWSPAVAFGFLLLTLAFRPSGIMGR